MPIEFYDLESQTNYRRLQTGITGQVVYFSLITSSEVNDSTTRSFLLSL